jgi:hypothetical protein
MEQHTITTYSFNELPEDTQEKAIEGLYDLNTHYDWWENVYEDAKTIAALMGIDITNIYFSGFSSQGDGACFEGSYEYKKGSVKAIKEYAPVDKELHRIAEAFQDIQRPNFYQVTSTIKHSGHYYHQHCTDISTGRLDDVAWTDAAEDDMPEVLRDFMHWIYRTLEKEHEYLTGEEAIKETIEANAYEFTENGDLY